MGVEDKKHRSHLPIATPERTGFVAYDAKDPDSKFPPIEQLRPPKGAPNVHRLKIMKVLLERGAKAVPDRNGRWLSILALQCECSDEVCDLIEAAESSKLSYRFFIDIPEAIPVGRIILAQEIGPTRKCPLIRGHCSCDGGQRRSAFECPQCAELYV